MSKLHVGIICGGKSTEHQVSLLSARNVVGAIDRDAYKPVIIGVTSDGLWHIYPEDAWLNDADDPAKISLQKPTNTVTLAPGHGGKVFALAGELNGDTELDFALPLIHGTGGEDGSLQGLFDQAGLAYGGADVTGSAVGMDKLVAKQLLQQAGINVAPYRAYAQVDELPSFDDLADELKSEVLFVKPVAQGSSVGVSRVVDQASFSKACSDAFIFDDTILVEAEIRGREVELAVLGNDQLQVSVAGEIIPQGHEFYSYESKYLDENGAKLTAPAEITEAELVRLQESAKKAYRALRCQGFARVDFFLTEDDIYAIEINTLPGFTAISMYPRLMGLVGVEYSELITRIIELGLERFQKYQQLSTNRGGSV